MDNLEKGLTKETYDVFTTVSRLKCIENLYLCGGTAISLQLGHRKSEDLDFELLSRFGPKQDLDLIQISEEMNRTFLDCRREILGNDHILFFINNKVKLSFFKPQYRVPSIEKGMQFNNLKTVSKQDLLGMKLYTITVRNAFRDYYDIFSLLKDGEKLDTGIKYACAFSRHQVHTKQILTILKTPSLFKKESSFSLLEPIYNVCPSEISSCIDEHIKRMSMKNGLGL